MVTERREREEITPRNSANPDAFEVDFEPAEPELHSELAQACAMAVDLEQSLVSDLAKMCVSILEIEATEPLLKSELAKNCVYLLSVEASEPCLESELAKKCAFFLRMEALGQMGQWPHDELPLKSDLAKACVQVLSDSEASEARSSESDESENEMSYEEASPLFDSPQKPMWNGIEMDPHACGIGIKLPSRGVKEIARRGLQFA